MARFEHRRCLEEVVREEDRQNPPEIDLNQSREQVVDGESPKSVDCCSCFEKSLPLSTAEFTIIPQDYWDDLFEIAVMSIGTIECAE